MEDRLVWLLRRFELRARVFRTGPLGAPAESPAAAGRGFLHIVQAGSVRVRSAGKPDTEVHEPSALIYVNPTCHSVEPLDDRVSMICATVCHSTGST